MRQGDNIEKTGNNNNSIYMIFHTTKKYVKIYSLFIKSSLALFTAHRFDFSMNVIATMVWTFGHIISLQFIFSKTNAYINWTFADIMLLLGTLQVAYYLARLIYKDGLNQLSQTFLSGTLDTLITKPTNLQFLISFRQIRINSLISAVINSAIPFIIGLQSPNITVLKLPHACLTLTLGLIIMFVVELLIAGSTFFINDSRSLQKVTTTFFEFTKVPLHILPQTIQHLITYIIPVVFVSYYPVAILREDVSLKSVLFTEIVLLIVFISLSSLIWKKGLKRYTGIG